MPLCFRVVARVPRLRAGRSNYGPVRTRRGGRALTVAEAALIAGWLLAATAPLCGSPRGDAAAASSLERIAREEWMRRVSQLHRLTVSYTYRVERFPSDDELELNRDGASKGISIRIPTAPEAGSGTFAVDGTRWMFSQQLSEGYAELPGQFTASRQAAAFSNGRFERLYLPAGRSRAQGTIGNTPQLPRDNLVDVALGLRLCNGDDWADRDTVASATASTGNRPGTVVLTCTRSNGQQHQLTFEVGDKVALSAYRGLSPGGQAFADGSFGDFVMCGDVLLPTTIQWTFLRPDGTPRKKVLLQAHFSDHVDSDFLIEWPQGALVLDTRTGTPMQVSSGSRTLDDKTLSEAAAEARRRRIPTAMPPRDKQDIAGQANRPVERWLIVNVVLLAVIALGLVLRRRAARP